MEPLPNKSISIEFMTPEGELSAAVFTYPNREPEGEASPETLRAWHDMIDEGYFDGGTGAVAFQTVFIAKITKYNKHPHPTPQL